MPGSKNICFLWRKKQTNLFVWIRVLSGTNAWKDESGRIKYWTRRAKGDSAICRQEKKISQRTCAAFSGFPLPASRRTG